MNLDANSASGQIASRIAAVLFDTPASSVALEQARGIFAGLQRGEVDRPAGGR